MSQMNNYLGNGSVLPSGLLSNNPHAMMDGFKKTYRNTALKTGVIVQTYAIDNPQNISKLFSEYDVLTFEQNEDTGTSVSTYKNCPMASSLGGLADFFEMSLRKITKVTTQGPVPLPYGNNGSVVLLLCLNGLSDTGIIVGALGHPDRKTTIATDEPHLEGEYNGVNIVVNADGSTSLTFMGATDNYGNVIDSTQGNTVMSIEKDGSYQVMHKTITERLDKNGKYTLTTQDDITLDTQTDFDVNTKKDVNVSATGDFNATMNNLAMTAQGSAQLMCQKLDVQSQSDLNLNGQNFAVQAETMAGIKAPQITLTGMVALGGTGGQPLLLLSAIMYGTDSLGGPVISNAIAGFTLMVTGQ
jgi:hypothetical protein